MNNNKTNVYDDLSPPRTPEFGEDMSSVPNSANNTPDRAAATFKATLHVGEAINKLAGLTEMLNAVNVSDVNQRASQGLQWSSSASALLVHRKKQRDLDAEMNQQTQQSKNADNKRVKVVKEEKLTNNHKPSF